MRTASHKQFLYSFSLVSPHELHTPKGRIWDVRAHLDAHNLSRKVGLIPRPHFPFVDDLPSEFVVVFVKGVKPELVIKHQKMFALAGARVGVLSNEYQASYAQVWRLSCTVMR